MLHLEKRKKTDLGNQRSFGRLFGNDGVVGQIVENGPIIIHIRHIDLDPRVSDPGLLAIAALTPGLDHDHVEILRLTIERVAVRAEHSGRGAHLEDARRIAVQDRKSHVLVEQRSQQVERGHRVRATGVLHDAARVLLLSEGQSWGHDPLQLDLHLRKGRESPVSDAHFEQVVTAQAVDGRYADDACFSVHDELFLDVARREVVGEWRVDSRVRIAGRYLQHHHCWEQNWIKMSLIIEKNII